MKIKWLPLILIAACSSPQTTTTWSGDMNQLGQSLADIIPYAYDDEAYQDKKNRKIVLEKIEKLKASSHEIKSEKADQLLGQDPIVRQSIQNLKADLDEAMELYKQGDFSYSQNLLKSSLSYCYYCHTRTGFGPELKSNIYNIDFNRIQDPLQRSHALIATRQYDKALTDLRTTLLKEKDEKHQFFQDVKALKAYLSIYIKTSRDTKLAKQTLDSYVKTANPPFFLNESIKSWKGSLDVATAAAKNPKVVTQIRSRLARNESRMYADLQFVDYLIVAKQLHEDIMKGSAKKAEIYHELGIIYDRYPEFNMWDLGENYFESCILASPKTAIAKKCYKRLEESVYTGYSGSAGTFLPHNQILRLKMLKASAGL